MTNPLKFPEKFILAKDALEKEKGSEINLANTQNREELLKFILSKKIEVDKILNSNSGKKYKSINENGNSKVDWIEFIADQREILGLPKKVSYEVYNIYIQLIKTHNQNINFDDFLKLLKNKELKKSKGAISDNIDNLINNGGGSDFHSISEVISNAIDATNPQNVVGRFGKGFFQILRLLKEKGDSVEINSKKEKNKAFKILLENEFDDKTKKELLVGSSISDKKNIGTTITVSKKFSEKEQKDLKKYISSKYRTNKYVNLTINDEKINDLGDYVYVNGIGLQTPTKIVKIKINGDGIQVIDTGIGMNSEDLSSKLLFPNDTSKPRKQPLDKDLKEVVKKEVYFFYKKGELKQIEKNNQTKKEKTTISLMVGGVIIESFHTHTSSDMKDFVLEFPSFTYLQENKGEISLTKEVILTLQTVMEKIHKKIDSRQEKLSILEILGKIVNKLKQRPTEASNSGKFNIDKILKKNFVKLKQDLEKDGTTILSGEPALVEALGARKGVKYISPDFEKLDFKNIPGIQKLENISNSNTPFYTIDFQKNSKISYIITKNAILVDSKYLNNPDTIDIVNTLINLNTSYENSSNIASYGNIVDGKVISEKKDFDKNKSKTPKKLNIDKNNPENPKKPERSEKVLTFINSDLNILEDYLIDENYFNKYKIQNKIKYLKEDNFLENNDISKFYSEDGVLNDDIKFYLLSGFSYESGKSFKHKKQYLNFFEDASVGNKKIILNFQNLIKNSDKKNEYFKTVLDLLDNGNLSQRILSLLSELGNDSSLLWKIELFKKIENNEEVDLYQVYKKDLNLLKKIFEEKLGEPITFLFGIREIDGGIGGRLKIDGTDYPFMCKYGEEIQIIKKDKEGNDIKNCLGITEIEGGIGGIVEIDGTFYPFMCKYGEEIQIIKKDKEGNDIKDVDYITKIDGGIGGIGGIVKIDATDYPFIWKYGEEIQVMKIYKEGNDIESYFDITEIDGGIGGSVEINGLDNVYYPFMCKTGKEMKIMKTDKEGNDIKDLDDITEIDGGIGGTVRIGTTNYPFMWKYGEEIQIIKKDKEGNDIKNCFGITEIDGGIGGRINIDGITYPFMWKYGEEIQIMKTDNEGNDIEKVYSITEIDGGIGGRVNIYGIIYSFMCKYGEEVDIFNKTEVYNLGDIQAEIGLSGYNFLTFLDKGGEFLDKGDLEPGFDNLNSEFKLSELIYLNCLDIDNFEGVFTSEDKETQLDKCFSNLKKQDLNYSVYNRKILSQIDGQDKSSQLWIREATQNSIDAIKKSGEKNKNIDLNFYENNGNFVSAFIDNVGMNFEEVFKYLLPIGKSGKLGAGGIGKFGQGFFSLFIGAKEVRVKTSDGNGRTTYLKIKPIYNEDNLIEDFTVAYEVKQEKFKGTKIERIDDADGFEANLSAMFAVNNITKYVGCTEGINVNYNGKKVNGTNEILQSESIENIGELRLIKNNGYDRISKDGLFMSEIKEKYIDIFPDWIVEIIKQEKLTIDIPTGIELVSSRSEFANSEDLENLKPYIFNIIMKYIVSLAVEGKIKIPMLPEDFFGNDNYERQNSSFNEIFSYANKINGGGILDYNAFEELKDKQNSSFFLALVNIEKNGEKVSFKTLKERRDDENFRRLMTSGSMSEAISEGKTYADAKENDKKIEVSETEKMTKFKQNIFDEYGDLLKVLGLEYLNIGFFEGQLAIADASGGSKIRFNINYLDRLKSDKNELIKTMTHELTHLKEGNDKWGTHEKDLEHNNSFEKIQREILEVYLRLKSGYSLDFLKKNYTVVN